MDCPREELLRFTDLNLQVKLHLLFIVSQRHRSRAAKLHSLMQSMLLIPFMLRILALMLILFLLPSLITANRLLKLLSSLFVQTQ